MIYFLTLNWNGKDKMNRLVSSIKPAIDGLDYKWIVRDNGSNDLTDNLIQDWSKKTNMLFYKNGHNRDSFATGVNWCFNVAHPTDEDYIFLLNNDIEFIDTKSINKMISIADSDQNVGIVGARLLYNGTNNLQHAGVIFGERYGLMPYHYRHKEVSDANAERNREFQAVTAAFMLVRAAVWMEVGGFDQGYSWSFEDVDFCLKVRAAGKKVVYCGGTKIYHEESASLKKNPVNKMFMKSNVNHFRSKWSDKYDIDHNKYLTNPNYMIYA